MTGFIKSLLKKLIDNDYRFAGLSNGGDTVTENTAYAICIKAVPPILYIVSVINGDNITPEDYERQTAVFMDKVCKNKADMNCTYSISVNIMAVQRLTEGISAFINAKDYDPSVHDYTVWWAADISLAEITAGKNMPTDTAGLKRLAEASFGGNGISDVSAIEKAVENKRSRERITDKHTAVLAIIAVTAGAYIFMELFGGSNAWAYILGNEHTRIAVYGEYYRLITCMLVHAGYAHLAFNCVALYAFGTRVEEYLGHAGLVLLYLCSGICGSVLSFAFTESLSVGASGGVYGTLGAALVLTLRLKHSIGGISAIAVAACIIGSTGIGLMMGNVDNFAHIGGLLFGMLFTAVYYTFAHKKG